MAVFVDPRLLEAIHARAARAPAGRPAVVLISGCQGSGKTTLAREAARQMGGVQISLDDVYLTQDQRREMARDHHPLFAIRGPPGTHDLALLAEVIARLAVAGPGDQTPLPAFDKLADERLPSHLWPRFTGRPQVILIDGWCLGAKAQDQAALAEPVNALERDGDPDGVWRRAANARLADEYADFVRAADGVIFLQAPSFQVVLEWRAEQQADLLGLAPENLPPEERVRLANFIQHFERITHSMLTGFVQADTIVKLDRNRSVVGWAEMTSSVDRRLEPRRAADIRAVIMTEGFEIGARIVDQSDNGLRLRLDRAMGVQGRVTVIDILRGVAIEADVAWTRTDEAGLKKRAESPLRGLVPARLTAAREAWMRAGGR